MTDQLPYPFDAQFLRRNKAFMLFCPPDRLDAEQRPVLEGRSMLYKLPSAAYQACPYEDSRAGTPKLINVDSLKALSRHQDDVVRLIDGVGHYLFTERGGDGEASDLGHLYALAYVCYRAPSLYFCRKLLDEKAQIPAVCSVSSRFFHGLLNMLALIALEHDGDLSGLRMTAEQLYRYGDGNGHLIGKKEACAASRTTIVRYLAWCLEACAPQVRESGPSSVPFDVLVRIARMTMALEFASLVYETLRCWSWRRTAGGEAANVRQMFATTHCLQARKMAQSAEPFEHVLFRRAFNQMLALGDTQPGIDKLVQLARDSVQALLDGSIGPARVHERLKQQMQIIFAHQAEYLEQHVIGGSYLSADLDVFFGNWPD